MDSVAGSVKDGNFEGVIRIKEGKIRSHVDEVVRETVEQTLTGGASSHPLNVRGTSAT
jgi:hypothetical protein